MAIFLKGKVNDAMAAALLDPMSFGDGDVFLTEQSRNASVAALDDTTVVVAYRVTGSSASGAEVRVGKLTGTNLAWGDPVDIQPKRADDINLLVARDVHVVALDSTRIVVTFGENALGSVGRVGVVSGTAVTFPFGNEAQFDNNTSDFFGRDSELVAVDANTVLVCYRDSGAGGAGIAKIGTVSGDNITWGTAVQFHAGDSRWIRADMLDASRFAVIYQDITPDVGKAKIGTIVGTTVSFGPEAVYVPAAGPGLFKLFWTDVVAMDPSTIVVAYHDDSTSATTNSGQGRANVGSISGNTIAFGPQSTFRSADGIASGAAEDLSLARMEDKVVVFYNSPPFPATKVGTIAAGTITWSAEIIMSTSGAPDFSLADGQNVAVLPSGDKAVFINTRGFSIGKVGSLGGDVFGSSAFIEASDPSAYPEMSGAGRVTMAVWTNEPTKLNAELIVRRDFVIKLNATSMELTKGITAGALWDDVGIGTVMTALNDGTPHLLVLDFEHQGSGSWILRTSIDGNDYVDQGLQNSGTQDNNPPIIAPSITLSNPDPVNQWAEEAVMWADVSLFTGDELMQLFELGTLGLDMDQFVEVFKTTGLLANENVVFYHPLDNAVEDTRTQTWEGDAAFTAGKIGDGDSAIASSGMSFSAEEEFNPNHTEDIAMVKLDDTRVFITYRNETGPAFNSNDPGTEGLARIGVLSAGMISFGPSFVFADMASSGARNHSVAILNVTSVVVTYRTGSKIKSKAGIISGTAVSFGTEVQAPLNPAAPSFSIGSRHAMAVLDSSRVFMGYVTDNIPAGFGEGTAAIATVSGANITWGTAVTWSADARSDGMYVAKLDTDRVLISDMLFVAGTTTGQMRVADVTGTSITVGPDHQFVTVNNSGGHSGIAVLDPTTFVVTYAHTSPTRIGRAKVGSVTGTNITFGSESQWRTFVPDLGILDHDVAVLDSTHIAISWMARLSFLGDTGGHIRIGTISGLTITFGGKSDFMPTSAFDNFATSQMVAMNSFDVVVAYGEAADGRHGTAKVGRLDPASSDLAAPDGTVYPSVVGDTRATAAFWAKNPTAGVSTVGVERGYSIKYTESTIELGGSVWNSLNDTVLYDAVSGTLPDEHGWSFSSSGGPAPTVSGGALLHGPVTGTDSQNWRREGLENLGDFLTDDFAVEFDLKIIQSGIAVVGGSFWRAGWSALVHDSNGRGFFFGVSEANGVILSNDLGSPGSAGEIANSTPFISAVTTDDFHKYRLEVSGGVCRILIDGIEVGSIAAGIVYSVTPDRILFGDGTSVASVSSQTELRTVKIDLKQSGLDAINDGSPHFLVTDFENVGGNSWRLRTSLDGNPYVNLGQQNTGSQVVVAADTVPQVALAMDSSLTSEQWVDELAYWGGRSDELSTTALCTGGACPGSTGDKPGSSWSVTAIDDTHVVACYVNASSLPLNFNGTARVGTIIGNDITWGPASEFRPASPPPSNISVTAISSDTVVVVYDRDDTVAEGKVGKIVGGTITWGSPFVYQPGPRGVGRQRIITLDSNRVVVAYINDAPNRGNAIVGDVRGTSIIWGTPVQFFGTEIDDVDAARLNATSFAIGFNTVGPANGRSIIGTVTGTDIVFGPDTPVNAGLSSPVILAALSPVHLVAAYRDVANSSAGTMKFGTVSGGSVVWGAASFVFTTPSPALVAVMSITALDSSHVAIHWREGGSPDRNGHVAIGTVDGGNISFGDTVDFVDGGTGAAQPPILVTGGVTRIGTGTLLMYQDRFLTDQLRASVITAVTDLFTDGELSNMHSLGATLGKRLDDYEVEFLGGIPGSSPIQAENAIFHHPLDDFTERLQDQLWIQTAVPPTTAPPPCPRCDGSTIVVDEDVLVDFNTVGAPTCTGDADLCAIFTFEKDIMQAPHTWKAIFDAGESKILVKAGITVEILGVPTTGKREAAPGLVMKSLCGVEIEDNATLLVSARTDRAGDIVIGSGGDCIVNGNILTVADFGQPASNISGGITIGTDCGDIITGPMSVIQTSSRSAAGDISLVSCGGDIMINGLVNASHNGDASTPTINIVAFGGAVTIDGNTVQGFDKKAKRQITSGVTVTNKVKDNPGSINIQAVGNVTVFGNILFDHKKPNLGAVGLATGVDSVDGGTIDVRSLAGDIVASDRAFDASATFKGDDIDDLGSNGAPSGVQAQIRLLAAFNISLDSTGRLNDPLSFQVAAEMAVVTSQAVHDATGGINTIRSHAGAVNIGPDACVLADHLVDAGLVGQTDITHCTGANIDPGACVRPDATVVSDCSVVAPVALFVDCGDFGIVFPE